MNRRDMIRAAIGMPLLGCFTIPQSVPPLRPAELLVTRRFRRTGVCRVYTSPPAKLITGSAGQVIPGFTIDRGGLDDQ